MKESETVGNLALRINMDGLPGDIHPSGVVMVSVFAYWASYAYQDVLLRIARYLPNSQTLQPLISPDRFTFEREFIARFSLTQTLMAIPETLTVEAAYAAWPVIVSALPTPSIAQCVMNNNIGEGLRFGLKPEQRIAHIAFWALYPELTMHSEARKVLPDI